jgi:AraC family transcriptional regulator
MTSAITLGSTLRTLATDSVLLTETAHRAGLELPPHTHANPNITLVLEGRFTEVIQHHPFDCGPSSLLVKPAGALHSDRYGRAAVRELILEFPPDSAERIRRHSGLLSRPGQLDGGPLYGLAIRVYREFRQPDRATPVIVEGLVLEIIGAGERRRSRDEPGKTRVPLWAVRARDLIHDRFRTDVPISAIAAEVGVHPAHLARTFKRCFGSSIGAHVRELRIEYAKQLLRDSSLPLADVSSEAGFYDQSHLTNALRRASHLTPRQYRALLGGPKARERAGRTQSENDGASCRARS